MLHTHITTADQHGGQPPILHHLLDVGEVVFKVWEELSQGRCLLGLSGAIVGVDWVLSRGSYPR